MKKAQYTLLIAIPIQHLDRIKASHSRKCWRLMMLASLIFSPACCQSMPKTSSNSDFLFQKSVQISEAHCGPAVLQMLLGNIGIDITQHAIAEAAGITKT